MPKITLPIETLIDNLHGADWQKRCDAARLLGLSRDPRAVDALLPDLGDEDWRVRRNAVQALGASKDPRALGPLIDALNDRVATVRERAAVGLGRIKDPRAIPALIDALMEDKKSHIHFNEGAWQALRKFGAKAGPAMVALVKAKPNAYLIDLLIDLKYEGQAEALKPLTNHADPILRRNAITALAQTGDPSSIDSLLDALRSPDMGLQLEAVGALGRLHITRAIPSLLGLLSGADLYGPQAALARAVTEAMQEMSGIKADLMNAFPLPSATTFGIPGGGMNLAEMMGQLGNENFQKLNHMLSDAESRAEEVSEIFNLPPEVVKAVSDQTWKFGAMFADARDAKTEQVKTLIALIKSAPALKRAATCVSLPWYMERAALEPLEGAMLDEDELVRRAAGWAHAALKNTLGSEPSDRGEGS